MFETSGSGCGLFAIWLALFKCCQQGSEAIRLLNFIGGVGIPVGELGFESVTTGYILRAQYVLPSRTEDYRQKIKPQTVNRRRRSGNDTYFDAVNTTDINGKPTLPSAYHQETAKNMGKSSNNILAQKTGVFRWILYKVIEMALNKSGLIGHVCLLRCICEHAATPFGCESGLLAEILHIILTPSTSQDHFQNSVNQEYLNAEFLGRSESKNCVSHYEECSKSPMELISTIFDS